MVVMSSIFSRIKERRYCLEHTGLRLVASIIPRLPFECIAPLANAIGRVVYHFDAHGRATAHENLRAAFGDAYDPEQREIIARKSYQTFACTMLSMFWLPNLNEENYRDYIRVEGTDNDPVHRDPSLAGVYFLAHYGNFEWLSWVSAYAIMAGLVITQELKNPLLNATFDGLRTGSGHTLIPRARAIVRMLKFLKTGGKVGAAADLSIDPRLGAVPVRCFGMWTPMSPMAAVLAQRANAALVPSLIFPEEDGRYRVVYRQPLKVSQSATNQEIAQACWDVFEEVIRERPELWLWSYKHWRFRPENAPDGIYPDYSHVAKRFDRMLEEARADGLASAA